MKEKELAEKKRLQEEEQMLKREREEAEKKYKEFKITTFMTKLSQVLNLEKRKAVRNGFTSIIKYNIFMKTNFIKVKFLYTIDWWNT